MEEYTFPFPDLLQILVSFFICFLKSHISCFFFLTYHALKSENGLPCVLEHRYLSPATPGNGTILSLKITSDNPEQQVENLKLES